SSTGKRYGNGNGRNWRRQRARAGANGIRIHGICAVAHRALLQGPRKLAPRSEVPRLFEVVDVGSVSTSRPDNGRVTTGNLHLVRGGPQGSGARMPAMRAFLKLPTIDLPVVQPRSPLHAACLRVLQVHISRH